MLLSLISGNVYDNGALYDIIHCTIAVETIAVETRRYSFNRTRVFCLGH